MGKCITPTVNVQIKEYSNGKNVSECLNNTSQCVYKEALSGHPTLSPYNFHTNIYYTK